MADKPGERESGAGIAEAATQLERRARQVASGWEAELRIAVDALIPAERLFPLIEAFYAAGHTTEIRLSNEVLADTTRALTARSAGLLSGQATLVVATVESKVAAQVAGLGVGYLPRALAEQEAARGRLVIRETAEPRLPTQLHLAWCSSHRGQALAWFTQRLREAETRAALLP